MVWRRCECHEQVGFEEGDAVGEAERVRCVGDFERLGRCRGVKFLRQEFLAKAMADAAGDGADVGDGEAFAVSLASRPERSSRTRGDRVLLR